MKRKIFGSKAQIADVMVSKEQVADVMVMSMLIFFTLIVASYKFIMGDYDVS